MNDQIENKIKKDDFDGFWTFIQLRDGNMLCGCFDALLCIYNTKFNTLELKKKKIHE